MQSRSTKLLEDCLEGVEAGNKRPRPGKPSWPSSPGYLMKYISSILFGVLLTATTLGCSLPADTPTPLPEPTGQASPRTPIPSLTRAPSAPTQAAQEPSYRVAAFYYPWYRNKQFDGDWAHWDQSANPPDSIGSDFYPLLGAYSSVDPAVIAQHFAWLREAGVGVIVSSWWGQGSREDKAVPVLLDIADEYDIKVAFHMEPYDGRSATTLVQDIEYLYRKYGAHGAFFRTTEPSRWSPDNRPKGLFYLWSSGFPDSNSGRVEPSYWREALDLIHSLPDGGLVLADENASEWVDGGTFDGLYNYGVLDISEGPGYRWARSLPPEAWYVPGVNPGFSAIRIQYPPDLNTPRRDGDTYEDRWESALGEGVEPSLVTITTFNEWHEGTQIEPAAAGVSDTQGVPYQDYGALPPEGYLTLTRKWVDAFLAYSWPETVLLRIRLTTTSDWTDLHLVSGATWLRPDILSVSETAKDAGVIDDQLVLNQPLQQAKTESSVEVIVDVLLSDSESGEAVAFKLERGDVGFTEVAFSRVDGDEVLEIDRISWGGTTGDGRNAFHFEIPAVELFGQVP